MTGGLLPRRRPCNVNPGALEIKTVCAIARLQVHDTTPSESRDRSPDWHAHALKQASFRVHDVVDELSLLRLRRRGGKDPEIPVGVGHRGVPRRTGELVAHGARPNHPRRNSERALHRARPALVAPARCTSPRVLPGSHDCRGRRRAWDFSWVGARPLREGQGASAPAPRE